jgi:glycosyltransferase involved in cell wall biosynthesis
MRILHVIPYMHPSAGGPPVVVENFVREAGKLGHCSEIVSTSLFCDCDEQRLLEGLNQIAPTYFLPQLGGLTVLNPRVSRRLRESIRIADIVHLHTLWNPLNVIVRRECERIRRPYVLMPHGMLDPYSLSVKRWRKIFYLRLIERKNILAAHRLIYTTTEEARLAATQIASLPRGVVIPLGGDAPVGNSRLLASRFLERFPQARGRRQLLFLGRLHFKKGLDLILTALPAVVQAFPDVLLTIVGGGSLDFKAKVREAIRAQNLERNVMMTGRLEGPVKWGAYASAELFLLPSRQENFAITVAEAMHIGVPVIISRKVNTWPYVKDAGAGVVLDEEQIEVSLEKSILSLLNDVETRHLMRKRAQEFAQANLTWSGATASLLECYDDLLCSRDRTKFTTERSSPS